MKYHTKIFHLKLSMNYKIFKFNQTSADIHIIASNDFSHLPNNIVPLIAINRILNFIFIFLKIIYPFHGKYKKTKEQI